ncbi:MAG TPA: hypothetical protein VL986_09160 [Terracidiphilus sp.]|nr:hypothetical protein [Terracidiphilus sp.]
MKADSVPAQAGQLGEAADSGRGFREILKSYFYWTYKRGSFHYDIMVTLILLFIFVAPQFWNFGDRPSTEPKPSHPITVSGDGGRGVIITVDAADVIAQAGASDSQVKRALRRAIEPVTGDDVYVERWMTVTTPEGRLAWKVWAHK